jgi:hypothetical protein
MDHRVLVRVVGDTESFLPESRRVTKSEIHGAGVVRATQDHSVAPGLCGPNNVSASLVPFVPEA